MFAGRSYLSVLNRDIFDSGLRARAVKDQSVPDEEIEHATSISDPVAFRSAYRTAYQRQTHKMYWERLSSFAMPARRSSTYLASISIVWRSSFAASNETSSSSRSITVY